jgi:hypothetical protein
VPLPDHAFHPAQQFFQTRLARALCFQRFVLPRDIRYHTHQPPLDRADRLNAHLFTQPKETSLSTGPEFLHISRLPCVERLRASRVHLRQIRRLDHAPQSAGVSTRVRAQQLRTEPRCRQIETHPAQPALLSNHRGPPQHAISMPQNFLQSLFTRLMRLFRLTARRDIPDNSHQMPLPLCNASHRRLLVQPKHLPRPRRTNLLLVVLRIALDVAFGPDSNF